MLALLAVLAGAFVWLRRRTRPDLIGTCLRLATNDPARNGGEEIVRLGEEERAGYLRAWRSVCDRFEEDPAAAVLYADVLVSALVESCDPPGSAGGIESFFKELHGIVHQRTTDPLKPVLTRLELRQTMEVYSAIFERLAGARSGGGSC